MGIIYHVTSFCKLWAQKRAVTLELLRLISSEFGGGLGHPENIGVSLRLWTND